jgi:hypothetical protein
MIWGAASRFSPTEIKRRKLAVAVPETAEQKSEDEGSQLSPAPGDHDSTESRWHRQGDTPGRSEAGSSSMGPLASPPPGLTPFSSRGKRKFEQLDFTQPAPAAISCKADTNGMFENLKAQNPGNPLLARLVDQVKDDYSPATAVSTKHKSNESAMEDEFRINHQPYYTPAGAHFATCGRFGNTTCTSKEALDMADSTKPKNKQMVALAADIQALRVRPHP